MHLLVIFLIALVVFGPRKLPELGKGLGEALRGFKEAFNNKRATEGEAENGKSDSAGGSQTGEPKN